MVKVTYKDGMMKGSAIAFTIVDRNTVTNAMYTLRRISNGKPGSSRKRMDR